MCILHTALGRSYLKTECLKPSIGLFYTYVFTSVLVVKDYRVNLVNIKNNIEHSCGVFQLKMASIFPLTSLFLLLMCVCTSGKYFCLIRCCCQKTFSFNISCLSNTIKHIVCIINSQYSDRLLHVFKMNTSMHKNTLYKLKSILCLIVIC